MVGVNHGYGLMKIMLAHHLSHRVSSRLESEIGRPPSLLILARQGKLVHGGIRGREVNFHRMSTCVPPRPVVSG